MALEVEKLDAFNGLQTGNFDRLTDLELGDIDGDRLWKILRETAHAELLGVHFKNSTLVLDAKGLSADANRHADFEFLVSLNFLEVDVEVFVRDRVPLNFLEEREGLLRLVRARKFHQDGATANGLQEADELRTFDRKRLRTGVLPVENRRNAVGLAEAA